MLPAPGPHRHPPGLLVWRAAEQVEEGLGARLPAAYHADPLAAEIPASRHDVAHVVLLVPGQVRGQRRHPRPRADSYREVVRGHGPAGGAHDQGAAEIHRPNVLTEPEGLFLLTVPLPVPA